MARKRHPNGLHPVSPPRRLERPFGAPMRQAVVSPSRPGLLGLLQDNRQWHPGSTFRPAVSIGPRSAKRLVVKSKPNALRNDISARIGFAVPNKVVKCIRRKQRKEVLHAKGIAGTRVSRRRRRDSWSDVDCT